MIPDKPQMSNVISLDAKRAEKNASASPFGPIQSGIVAQKPDVKTDEE